MSYMGVHFAISTDDYRALQAIQSEAERVDYVSNVIEEAWDENFASEIDRAWPLIHSALQMTNPCSDDLERGTNGPASWAILGDEDLALTDDAMVTHLGKWRSWRVSRHLRSISADEIRTRLASLIERHACERLSAEDADYAAGWYPKVVEFYSHAVHARRHVIFSADLC